MAETKETPWFRSIKRVLLTNPEDARNVGYTPREEGYSAFHPLSLSPSERFLAGRFGGADDCFCALELIDRWEDCALCRYVGNCVNPLTFGLFSRALWLEENRLLKCVFFDFDSGEEAVRRIKL